MVAVIVIAVSLIATGPTEKVAGSVFGGASQSGTTSLSNTT